MRLQIKILVFFFQIPFIQLAHDSKGVTATEKHIGLPWETPQTKDNKALPSNPMHSPFLDGTFNNNPIFTLADPSLGETVGAVDPSEVKTLSESPGAQPIDFDPSHPFSQRLWRRRRPFWRRHQFGFNGGMGGMPDLNFGIPVARPLTHTTNMPGVHNEHTQGHNSIQDLRNNANINKPPGVKTESVNLVKIDPISEKQQSASNSNSINVNGILQEITKTVVSNLVDKLVDRVVPNNQNPTDLPPQAFASGRGFSQPFIIPADHTHGPGGEIIPLSNFDQSNMLSGQFLPAINGMANGFGHRNFWNHNPFLQSAGQNPMAGWIMG